MFFYYLTEIIIYIYIFFFATILQVWCSCHLLFRNIFSFYSDPLPYFHWIECHVSKSDITNVINIKKHNNNFGKRNTLAYISLTDWKDYLRQKKTFRFDSLSLCVFKESIKESKQFSLQGKKKEGWKSVKPFS